jgi:hypothetical protein
MAGIKNTSPTTMMSFRAASGNAAFKKFLLAFNVVYVTIESPRKNAAGVSVLSRLAVICLLVSENPGTSKLVRSPGKKASRSTVTVRKPAVDKNIFLNRFPDIEADPDRLLAKTGSSDGYISSLTSHITERVIPMDAKYTSAVSSVPKKWAITNFSTKPNIFVHKAIVERLNTVFAS